MKILKSIFLSLLLMTGFSTPSFAGVAVIVHPDNNNQVNAKQVRKIFLGKTKTFPDGNSVTPLDLASGNNTRDAFIKNVLKKNESALSSHWARMLFSSKGKPPKVMEDATELKAYVAKNASAIGYLDAADVDSSVKVLLELP